MIKHLIKAPQSAFQRPGISVYARHYRLQPADRLIEPIFQTGISKHHSIYLGVDAHGTEWIAENHKFVGVRLIKAVDFFRNKKHITVEQFTGTFPERIAAVKRALSLLGEPYDLISYNCEHYASYVQTGKAKSKQVNEVLDAVKTFVGVAVIIGLFNAIVND